MNLVFHISEDGSEILSLVAEFPRCIVVSIDRFVMIAYVRN